MKIKPEHYAVMKDAIQKIADRLPCHKENLKHDPRVKDIEKRLRWDAMEGAGLRLFVCDTLYSYLNDEHIDSALRAIMKEVA